MGINGVEGIFVIIGFFAGTTLIIHLYTNRFLMIEEDGEQTDLYTEGLAVSFALFMLTWISTYSFLYKREV